MEFRVSKPLVRPDTRGIPSELRAIATLSERDAKVRYMAFREYKDAMGEPIIVLLNARRWHGPITTQPRLGDTEVWHLINPTDDAHPIHLHLVRFEVLDRQKFNTAAYLRDWGAARPGEGPDPIAVEPYWTGHAQSHPRTNVDGKTPSGRIQARLSVSSRASTAMPENIHGIATCLSMRTTR